VNGSLVNGLGYEGTVRPHPWREQHLLLVVISLLCSLVFLSLTLSFIFLFSFTGWCIFLWNNFMWNHWPGSSWPRWVASDKCMLYIIVGWYEITSAIVAYWSGYRILEKGLWGQPPQENFYNRGPQKWDFGPGILRPSQIVVMSQFFFKCRGFDQTSLIPYP